MLKIKFLLILFVIPFLVGSFLNLHAQIVSSDWKMGEVENTLLKKADRARLDTQHSNWRSCQISTQYFLTALRSEK